MTEIDFSNTNIFDNEQEYPNAAHDMKMFAYNYRHHPNARTLIPRHQRRLHDWYHLCHEHAEELKSRMNSGEVGQINDWGGGWSWTADVIITKDGMRFRLFGNGAVSPYTGQHDKPVYIL